MCPRRAPSAVGIGCIRAGTAVLLMVTDLHIRILNAVTGEQLRELTLDPTRKLRAIPMS